MADLNDPEVKAAIKAAVDEATEALAANNKKLLAELKEARKGKEIDPAEFNALQEEKEALEGKLTEALKTTKAAVKEAETAKKALEEEAGFVSKLLVDNGLTDALLKANVKPELSKAVKAMLASQVQLKAEGSERIAMIGDKKLNDFISEWAKSDEGKHFVAAPNNQGGGANGGSSGGGEIKTMTRSAFEALDPIKKVEFSKSGGTLTNT
ncbi:MAG: hypothetical protein PHW03_05490 [Eubacteriales bacterium]|nr:hypothetical protein [Eubacteriales bacterium]